MTERPILFSGPLVRAILAGRKTETRRLVTRGTSECRDAANDKTTWPDKPIWSRVDRATLHDIRGFYAYPRVEPGDLLWVRERIWQSRGRGYMAEWGEWEAGAWTRSVVRYHATDGAPETTELPGRQFLASRPSIHMPMWASRISLRVTEVRAERLQEIDDAGSKAEGVEPDHSMEAFASGLPSGHYRSRFRLLWDQINGKRDGASWDDDPLVWVYKFERVKP